MTLRSSIKLTNEVQAPPGVTSEAGAALLDGTTLRNAKSYLSLGSQVKGKIYILSCLFTNQTFSAIIVRNRLNCYGLEQISIFCIIYLPG